MNKRIKELLDQATTNVRDQYGNWINFTIDHEAFARLVIHECIIAIENIPDNPECFEEEKYQLARQKINLHLGLE